MKVTGLKLRQVPGDDGFAVARPSKLTVEMSIQEAVAITHIASHFTSGVNWDKAGGSELAKMSHHNQRQIREACSAIYGGLVGDALNRYYEDGMTEAVEEFNR